MKIIAVTDDKMETSQLLDTLLSIESSIDAVILREKSKTDSEVIDVDSTINRIWF